MKAPKKAQDTDATDDKDVPRNTRRPLTDKEQVDELDTKIIRHLFFSPWPFQWTVRRPFAHVAREIGVTDDTVRARVRRMENSGFLLGWETGVSPSVLGRELINLDIPDVDDDKKEKAIELILLLDGVRWVHDMESGLRVMFFQRQGPGFDRIVELVSKICGAPAEPWTIPVAAATRRPSPADWRLIRAIRKDPRKPMKDLERLTGMSRRTVQRRLARLTESRAIFVSPVTDFTRLGGFFATVRVIDPVHIDPVKLTTSLLDEERTIATAVDATTPLGLYIARDEDDLKDLELQVKKSLGSDHAQLDVVKRRITCQRWMDDVVTAHAFHRVPPPGGEDPSVTPSRGGGP